MLDIIKGSEDVSCLDLGCGTASLNTYIVSHDLNNITYSGLDLGEKVLKAAMAKFPDLEFYNLDILDDSKTLPAFDYIIANGLFTEKRQLSFDEMWSYFKATMLALKPHFTKGLAFNVMSKEVDWEREDLFHLPTDMLINFITREIGKRYIIRQDYGLYEYTVYIYK